MNIVAGGKKRENVGGPAEGGAGAGGGVGDGEGVRG